MASTQWTCITMVILLSVFRIDQVYARYSSATNSTSNGDRQHISINGNWKFHRTEINTDGLIYDNRPIQNLTTSNPQILKPYILPSGNDFVNTTSKQHVRPAGPPGGNISYTQNNYDDSNWEDVRLPHDWAIAGPFYTTDDAPVTGGMGRLPVQGVGWYRRVLAEISASDRGRQIYLQIDGAMSYSIVWLNGQLVGGWPYGYASYRLDLTPFLQYDGENVLAIRLDNPVQSARWYPGGGLYRNVWLTKTHAVSVGQWGTYVTTQVGANGTAEVTINLQVENKANGTSRVSFATEFYAWTEDLGLAGSMVARISNASLSIGPDQKRSITQHATIAEPQLWSPWTQQAPSLYVAITRLYMEGRIIDTYETRFGVRTFTYTGDDGLLVNGKRVRIQGVNNHHDLGAIGAAFNVRAATRQLEILKQMGCNAIRMSHNPPAPELLDLTDRMGFLVFDEIFDSWEMNKTANDFHLIFDDWHEPDLRAFIRRDRNHPSVFVWSIGNEVGEQNTGQSGADLAQLLHEMVIQEDPTRPVAASMNAAKANASFPRALDVMSLNYQGEGIRNAPEYASLQGIATAPQYPAFHSQFPQKLLLESESAATYSSRGIFLFPVTNGTSAPTNDHNGGGNSTSLQVSDYGFYTADFGSSPDKVFAAQDANPFVAGEFVWSGFDYLGEPSPYYASRSSYYGIVDLAGFPKARYFEYQARWQPEVRTAYILPHWTWPDRVGLVTPIHVFSAADSAELFLNNNTLGTRSKNASSVRFRWDNVVYAPGELRVVTYKNGTRWAEDVRRTAGASAVLRVTADRTSIAADGYDLAYVSVEVLDASGVPVPQASDTVTFTIEGSVGELVATDNGAPADFTPFPSATRNAFSGKVLGIVRAKLMEPATGGFIEVAVSAEGLTTGRVRVQVV